MIMMFLQWVIDVNQKIQHGWTVLHETAIFGNTEVAKLLISKGANINAWDGYETPLDVSDKESDFRQILRKHGGMTGKVQKLKGNEESSNHNRSSRISDVVIQKLYRSNSSCQEWKHRIS